MKAARQSMRGYCHLYTGHGKGKTTAAFGLALRASQAGLRVGIFQFLKKNCGAGESALRIPRIRIVCFKQTHPIFCRARQSHASQRVAHAIARDLKTVRCALTSGRYDVVILDEIINCVSGHFLPEAAALDLIRHRPAHVELILTGRGATKRLIAAADYVTVCKKIKHPFDRGVSARRGIEY